MDHEQEVTSLIGRIAYSDSITSVRKRIEEKTGVHRDAFTLQYGKTVVAEDTSKWQNNTSVLSAVPRFPAAKLLALTVGMLGWVERTLSFAPDTSLQSIQKLLQETSQLPPEYQTLYLNTSQIDPAAATLQSVGARSEDRIVMVPRIFQIKVKLPGEDILQIAANGLCTNDYVNERVKQMRPQYKDKVLLTRHLPYCFYFIFGKFPGDSLCYTLTPLDKSEIKTAVLYVHTLTSKTLEIEVNLSETVRSLKMKIEVECGLPCDQQRLIFGGRQLEEERVLKEYGFKDEDWVHVVLHLRGC